MHGHGNRTLPWLLGAVLLGAALIALAALIASQLAPSTYP